MPNVVFIVSDQHNAKVFGHEGHPDVNTPHLDRLAREGTRFSRCVTPNPICTPTRVSFFSGQYVHNHGFYGLNGPNPGGLPTVLGHFRDAGYRTGAIGKIHCPEYWIEDDSDCFVETTSFFSVGGCPEYDNYLREKGVFADRDDDFYPEQGNRHGQNMDGRVSRLAYEDTVEAWTARRGIDFMAEATKEGKQFIAHISFPRPHEIYSPSEPYWSMYPDDEITFPPNFDYDMSLKAPPLKRMVEYWRKGDWTLFEPRTYDAGAVRKLRGYLGLVSQTDAAVGQILDWIDAAGIADDTIVAYTTDHGDYACEHGIIEKAPGICSDAITRVPMIWRWPGHIKANHVAGGIANLVDIPATFASLCGLTEMETSDGIDLSPLLFGEKRELQTLGVTEAPWSKSVRRGDFRFVYYPTVMFEDQYPDGFGELYNIVDDPWEMNNLYFNDEHADLIRDIRSELFDWLVTTTRPVTTLPRPLTRAPQTYLRYKNPLNFDGKVSWKRIKEMSDKRGRHEQNYL